MYPLQSEIDDTFRETSVLLGYALAGLLLSVVAGIVCDKIEERLDRAAELRLRSQ